MKTINMRRPSDTPWKGMEGEIISPSMFTGNTTPGHGSPLKYYPINEHGNINEEARTMRLVKPALVIAAAMTAAYVVMTMGGGFLKRIPQETIASLGNISGEGSDVLPLKKRGDDSDRPDKTAKPEGEVGADEHVHRLAINPTDALNVGIEMTEAGPARIKSYLELPGQVNLNAEKVCHVAPHVSGTVAETHKMLGDGVKKGEVIAVIDSRELAQAKSRYLVELKREELARTNFNRIDNLWKKSVSPEKDYLDAKQKLEEAEIERMAAAQKLLALGLARADIEELADDPDVPMMRYSLVAPLDGTVITKHMTRGEWITENRQIMCIADLSDVWVDVIVYPKYLASVHLGQQAVVKSDASDLQSTGVVSYVGPIVGEESRTAEARIVMPNTEGKWRPGLFVTVELLKDNKSADVAVQNDAIQYHDKQPVLFVAKEDCFEIRNVVLGRSDKEVTEVVKGLSTGEKYASANSFALKAELERSGAVCGSGHAH